VTFVLLVAAALLAASAAEAASVKEIFEKHNLLGTFAFNCAKPVGRDNRYFVHRALPSGQVQREMMSGPATRDFLVIWERGSDLGADRIALGGARDGEPAESVYQVEPGRARVLESTIAGRKEIAGGRFTGGGDTPWMYRCDASGPPGQASPGKPPAGSVAAPPAAEPMELVVNGRARQFLLVRPSSQGPRPTVIMLHGLNGTGTDVARRTGLDQLGPRAGFAAVFPDGLRNRWNHFLPGKEPVAFVQNSQQIGGVPDDVGFLKLLVADLVRRGISDRKRIYLAGSSNGGFMTLRMICADAELFAAAAVLVGGMPDVLGAECRPAKPIAMLMINGTADQIVPYPGGMVQPGNAFNAWSAERLVGFFRELNGCTATAEQSVLPNTVRNKVEVARWTRCAGAPVAFYRVVGGGHSAPRELDAGQVLLDFFRGNAL
jgi:polyhydroxybutyrate depolymerase